METVTSIFDWISSFNASNPYCDLVVLLMVILGGYFAKRNCSMLPINLTYSTLVCGTLFSMVYVLLLHLSGRPVDVVKCFISYCIATSLYELIVKQVDQYLQKRK